MLYLVSPLQPLQWIDMPSDIVDDAADHGIDLATLKWLPSEERTLDADTVRIALRRGAACRSGIVVSAAALSNVGRAEKLEATGKNLISTKAAVASSDQLMDALSPGWIAEGERLDAEVAADWVRSVAEARLILESDLSAPPKDALSAHWEALGGALPNPI